MHAHPTEILTKAWLEVRKRRGIERPTSAGAQRLTDDRRSLPHRPSAVRPGTALDTPVHFVLLVGFASGALTLQPPTYNRSRRARSPIRLPACCGRILHAKNGVRHSVRLVLQRIVLPPDS
jgi:hypothetical protein